MCFYIFSNLESLDEDVKSIETFNYTNNSAMRTINRVTLLMCDKEVIEV